MIYTSITPISCSDSYEDMLEIHPSLPGGLYFKNGTIYGYASEGCELTAFSVSSVTGRSHVSVIHLGGVFYWSFLSLVEAPLTALYIDSHELYIVRDVSLNGIKIHSNAMYLDVMANRLPSGLVIDKRRKMVVGSYDDNYSGIFNSTLQICNDFGCFFQVFSFILSCMFGFFSLLLGKHPHGFSYAIYDIACGVSPNSFSTLSFIDNLPKVKEGISTETDIASSLMSSSLYMPTSGCQLIVIDAYLGVFERGFYSFRMVDDSLSTHVRDDFHCNL